MTGRIDEILAIENPTQVDQVAAGAEPLWSELDDALQPTRALRNSRYTRKL